MCFPLASFLMPISHGESVRLQCFFCIFLHFCWGNSTPASITKQENKLLTYTATEGPMGEQKAISDFVTRPPMAMRAKISQSWAAILERWWHNMYGEGARGYLKLGKTHGKTITGNHWTMNPLLLVDKLYDYGEFEPLDVFFWNCTELPEAAWDDDQVSYVWDKPDSYNPIYRYDIFPHKTSPRPFMYGLLTFTMNPYHAGQFNKDGMGFLGMPQVMFQFSVGPSRKSTIVIGGSCKNFTTVFACFCLPSNNSITSSGYGFVQTWRDTLEQCWQKMMIGHQPSFPQMFS